MPRMTLLEVVQNVLSAMDSDEVQSFTDTVESEQVAMEAKRVFYEFSNRIDLESQENLIQLQSLSDPSHPNYLLLPEGTSEILEVRYDNRKDVNDTEFKYEPVKYLDRKSFLDITTRFQADTEDTKYDTITDFTGVKLSICKTRAPCYFTSFDDKHLVFDAYNSNVETTMTQARCMCYGRIEPTFVLKDDFVIPLDSRATMAYLAEVISSCFVNIKQQGNSKEEQRARRGFLGIKSKHSRIANPWGLDEGAFDFGMPSKRGIGKLCPGPNNVNLSS